jgi:hypothetical protein
VGAVRAHLARRGLTAWPLAGLGAPVLAVLLLEALDRRLATHLGRVRFKSAVVRPTANGSCPFPTLVQQMHCAAFHTS